MAQIVFARSPEGTTKQSLAPDRIVNNEIAALPPVARNDRENCRHPREPSADHCEGSFFLVIARSTATKQSLTT
jgi:hypothetical protein